MVQISKNGRGREGALVGLEIECYRLAKDKESDKMEGRIV